jgi:hypothetical protein
MVPGVQKGGGGVCNVSHYSRNYYVNDLPLVIEKIYHFLLFDS